MKRILFAYLYCNLGGVATVIKQRMPILRRDGWEVHGIFKQDNGGVGDLQRAGMSNVRVCGRDFPAEIQSAAAGNEYDVVVVVDEPETLRRVLAVANSVVYEIHTPIDDVLLKNDAEILARCPIIVVPSEWSKRWLLSYFSPIDAERVRVCPNIVDPDDFVGPIPRYPRFYERELVWVGKIAKYKNWREALRVARLLLDDGDISRITCISGGNMTRELAIDLMTEVANLGLTKDFRWLHNLPYQDMISAYRIAAQRACVLLSCSVAESFCYVVHEALRAGLPVVSTNVGALTDILPHDEQTSLYEPGDYETAAALIADLTRSAPRRDQQLQVVNRRFKERFSVNHLGATYTKVLSDLPRVSFET